MDAGNNTIDLEDLPGSEDIAFHPQGMDCLKLLRLSWVMASSTMLILIALVAAR
jgi:hypothetical protein